MKFIFILTLLIVIFYTLLSTYILYLESQKKKLIRKILIAGIIGIFLSLIPYILEEAGIMSIKHEYSPPIVLLILVLLIVFIINFFSENKALAIDDGELPKVNSEKKQANVIANWTESVLNIVEERREKRERRNNDRRKDGSFIKLDSENSGNSTYKAPTLEISWHGIFSENISALLKNNTLIPKNIYSDFFLYFYKIRSNEILTFKIPKPAFSFLPKVSLDFSDISFDSGDKILICTKNLITSPNNSGDVYGEENVKTFLKENHRLTLKEFSGVFAEDLQDWFGDLNKEGKAAFSTIEVI